MGEPIRDFGKFLESLRGNMSLREAAKRSGLSHAYIRDLELERNRSTNEKIKPSPDTLQKLSNAYKYPYTDLMIKAGHLLEQDLPVDTPEDLQIDVTDIAYVEIGRKEIILIKEGSRSRKPVGSLQELTRFLEHLEENGFRKVQAEVYANFNKVRHYKQESATLYFDEEGTGLFVNMSAFRQRKYHEELVRRGYTNVPSGSSSFFLVDAHSLRSDQAVSS